MDLNNRKLEFGPKNGMAWISLEKCRTPSATLHDDIGMVVVDDKNTASM